MNEGRPDFSIAAATRADVADIHAMIGELAQFERLEHLVSGSCADLESELFCAKPVIEAVLARSRGEPAGFALFFHNYSTFLARRGLYLEDLYVRPAHRHRGLGRALLLHLAGVATERRCGRFEWMALDWNENAIRFYENLGATQMPEWRLFRVTGEALGRLAESRTQ